MASLQTHLLMQNVTEYNKIGPGHYRSFLIHLFKTTLSAVVSAAEIPLVRTRTMVPVVLAVTSPAGAFDICQRKKTTLND